jgi:hypothetical protein
MYEKTYKTNVLKQNQKTTIKKKRSFPWKRFILLVIILGILFGIGSMFRYSKMQIKDISVIGTNVIDQQEISKNINEQLVGTWLWIFPRTSVLLVNDKAIERNLKNKFSRIETVSVKRTNLHTVEVNIKEYDAVYLWCTNNEDDCYFMDKRGVVYSSAPVFSGTAYPKVFTGAPFMALPFLGIKTGDLNTVSEFQKKLLEINIVPVAFKFISPRELQIDFLHNKSVSKIFVDPTAEASTSLEYLFSGIRAEPLSSLFHNESKVLLYLDVRFPNKVVYKFQD